LLVVLHVASAVLAVVTAVVALTTAPLAVAVAAVDVVSADLAVFSADLAFLRAASFVALRALHAASESFALHSLRSSVFQASSFLVA